MILEETYTLSNGIEIPKLGLGTWFIDNANAASAVNEAVKIGYRHLDTAQAYGNEEGVGEGVRTSGMSRDELFVTTKLAAEVKSYEKAVQAIDASLTTTGLDHLDLMIIHSPQPWREFRAEDRYFEGNREAWRALEEAYEAGKLRAIGVSNFEREDIDNLLGACTVKPMVNQILVHIANTPHDLISYSQRAGNPGRGVLANCARRTAEERAGPRHRRQIRRIGAAAVDPLHAPARPAAAAKDRAPRAHEEQRPGRLRDLRRRHGDTQEHRPAR